MYNYLLWSWAPSQRSRAELARRAGPGLNVVFPPVNASAVKPKRRALLQLPFFLSQKCLKKKEMTLSKLFIFQRKPASFLFGDDLPLPNLSLSMVAIIFLKKRQH